MKTLVQFTDAVDAGLLSETLLGCPSCSHLIQLEWFLTITHGGLPSV